MKPFQASFSSSQHESVSWKVFALSGTHTHQSDLDTLKKISHLVCEGFGQVFPISRIASFDHLAWGAYSTVMALEGGFAHYTQPELEFLCRVAGIPQWQKAKRQVGLASEETSIVFVWVTQDARCTPSVFTQLATQWGLTPRALPWGKNISPPSDWGSTPASWSIESTALTDGR